MLLGVLPVAVSAASSVAATEVSLSYLSSAELLLDSLPAARRQDDKDSKKQGEKAKDAKDGAMADKGKDAKPGPKVVDIDKKKPNIKEVPKARPKLRPGTVTDRIKVKRQPVRVKPGKGLRIGL